MTLEDWTMGSEVMEFLNIIFENVVYKNYTFLENCLKI